MGLKHVMRRAMLWALVLLWCAPRAGVGYVVLTKEGYSVEHKLLAQAGARIVTDNCNNICGFLGQVCLRRWRILRQCQSRVLRARCVDWHGDSRVLWFLAARLQPWYGCLNTGCACHQLVGLCQPGVIPAVSGDVGASLCVDAARRCTLSRLHEER